MSSTGGLLMKPELGSQRLLGVTRSKAKMYEYDVPEKHHIKIKQDPAKLFTLSIGMLGDFAAKFNRKEVTRETIMDLQSNILFSAHFFDSYLQSKLNESLDQYLLLLGSASYYLCDLPGSATVLAKHMDSDCPNLDAQGLENLLLWLLRSDYKFEFNKQNGPFVEYIDDILGLVKQFFTDGTGEENLIDLTMKLRSAVYELGTPRQLLLCDIIAAVVRKKLENSCLKALPQYSGLPREKWMYALQKESFIKELWPAQHLLGQADVLKGESAIIQMPTSEGKTKAIELILRSAFLADRTSLTIIIAPFRALCHEIKNSLIEAFHNEITKVDELSDALQKDFEISELLGHPQILILTPEKLLYVLRHAPELATNVGLIVFDEGHQFDSGTRGITYELLLTSLRSMLPAGTQKVLISAVISNAEAVGQWLNGVPNVVDGTNLNPTFRSVGFASWLDQLGRIEYIYNQNSEQSEFFVPRVIERFNLGRIGRERRDRFFPEKSDGQAIALYLGLKLVQNGSIAVFCGRKTTASNICEKAVDFINHEIPFNLPLKYSKQSEIERLIKLHEDNLGADATASQSAKYGIFTHHGNTPHGIRLAVEYAMRENLIRFVICTSTLAQGVNLPIRYLIVTSVYQGKERIKVRDFHNLIGRAGRAGMHTEGSILFSDPNIYDNRNVRNEKWRWDQVKKLLEPQNSEPCISNLLSIFEPITSDDGKYTIPMEALDFAKDYISKPDEISKLATKIAKRHSDKGFSREEVERQVAWKINLISAIESFLLSHWDETEGGLSEEMVLRLSEETLAYFLADNQKKDYIRELFIILANNISVNITDSTRRKIYGRTLYGLNDTQAIEKWVQSNVDELLTASNDKQFLDLIWPLLAKYIHNNAFNKFNNKDVLKSIVLEWILGTTYHKLFIIADTHNCTLGTGKRPRKVKIDHIIDICESGIAYDGALIISAFCEFIEMLEREGTEDLVKYLKLFQKRIKYGLPTETTITIYELGFSDRVIAQDLALTLNTTEHVNKYIIQLLKQNKDKIIYTINKYPRYYFDVMNRYINN